MGGYYRNKIGAISDKVVLYVGQIIHRKGIDILLRAFKNVEAELYIVGGSITAELQQFIHEENLKIVHFVDFLSKKELVTYFRAADIFVLPTREDIWGLVINEAMNYMLPVITTDRCLVGMKLIIDGNEGYIVPTEDIDVLYHRIKKLLNDRDAAYHMGINARKKIKNYTIENMTIRHVDIFTRLVKRKRDDIR